MFSQEKTEGLLGKKWNMRNEINKRKISENNFISINIYINHA